MERNPKPKPAHWEKPQPNSPNPLGPPLSPTDPLPHSPSARTARPNATRVIRPDPPVPLASVAPQTSRDAPHPASPREPLQSGPTCQRTLPALSARAQRLSRTARHPRSPRPGPLAATPALLSLDRPLPSGPLVGASPPADDARSPFSSRAHSSATLSAVLLPFLTRSLTNRPAPSARLLPFFLPRARVHRRDHRRYPSLCTHIEISASFL